MSLFSTHSLTAFSHFLEFFKQNDYTNQYIKSFIQKTAIEIQHLTIVNISVIGTCRIMLTSYAFKAMR